MADQKNTFEDIKENVKSGAKEAFGNIKEGAKDVVENAKETVQNINVDEIKADVKETVQDVKEETQEVVQEAKAAVKGEKLDTADTVGGAGYREESSGGNGYAIASLVLGILSIVFALFGKKIIVDILALVMGIVGVVLGAKARKESQTGLATAGFVCSLIGLILSAIGFVCILACASAVGILGGCS